jgi:hypothetical protein
MHDDVLGSDISTMLDGHDLLAIQGMMEATESMVHSVRAGSLLV